MAGVLPARGPCELLGAVVQRVVESLGRAPQGRCDRPPRSHTRVTAHLTPTSISPPKRPDPYNNAMAASVVGLCNTELIRKKRTMAGPRPPRGGITSLLSQTAASRQLGGTPRESQPKEVADGSRANPANDLPDATIPQPQRPVTRIQGGGSVVIGGLCRCGAV